jgi:hypothetical protein
MLPASFTWINDRGNGVSEEREGPLVSDIRPSMEETNMRKCLLAAVAALSLLSTAGWANVERPATPSRTGPNFNAAMDEANGSARTKIRTADAGAARKSAVLERSAELGGL